ncbi:MAG: PDZ domain-containing protein [Candidatus Korobacteraceae bacterium]
MVSARNHKSKTQLTVLAAALLLTLPAFAGSAQSGAYLGVHIGDITPELAASLKLNDISGVVVESIDHDGPACKAGIKNKDVITSVAGTKIHNIQQMVEVMNGMAAGSTANIGIIRDGSAQNVKVTLGSRKNWMAATPVPAPNNVARSNAMAKSFVAPMPAMAYPADVDVPLMMPASARRGIIVEGLTTQLAEFLGVPNGQGVLVRNVQRGSLGANAGLKAGDVIIKIDGQMIRDLADWRRSMDISHGKISFSIIREKHEQVVDMAVPVPAGELRMGEDWDSLVPDMDAFNQQMQLLGPQIAQQTQAMLFSSDELEKMQREIQKSVNKDLNKELKRENKELKHQTKEIQKQMKDLEPQLRKQTEEVQKQMEQMRPEIEKQTQAAREQMERIQPEIDKQVREQMEQLGPQIQKQMQEVQKSMAILNDKDLAKMRDQINDSLKNIGPQIQEQMKVIGPQIQQQMQELQKQMQHQQEWQDMMKNWPNSSEKPNQM